MATHKKTLLHIVSALVLALSSSTFSTAQDLKPSTNNKGVFNITQIGRNTGFGNFVVGPNVRIENQGFLYRLRTTFGYFISQKIGVGIGAGLEAYHGPSYNNFPVVLDGRYYFKSTNRTPFINGVIGYSLKLSQVFNEGLHAGLSGGYKFPLGKKTNFLLSAGLEVHEVKDGLIILIGPNGSEAFRENFLLKSVSLNVGILF